MAADATDRHGSTPRGHAVSSAGCQTGSAVSPGSPETGCSQRDVVDARWRARWDSPLRRCARARLILVGDADQLASVEAGAVLADLVDGSVRDDALVAKVNRRIGLAR